jgi:hypothetical protein
VQLLTRRKREELHSHVFLRGSDNAGLNVNVEA